jgi:protocatechuate 3,4-dioxygenase beta subunit
MTSHNGTVPLITQIYFTGDPEIAKDPWASKSKSIVGLEKAGEAHAARFDIVLLRMG